MSRATGPSAVTRLALVLGFLAAGMIGATEFLARPWVVAGLSMEPALRAGDRVVVDLWTYRHRLPRRGEIVLFRAPAGLPSPLVKRVAAPPRFPADRPRGARWPGVAPEGAGVWVLGDHAAASVDSRAFGAVPRQRIIGRIVFRYWPPGRFGPVR